MSTRGYNHHGCALDSAAGLLQHLAQLPAARARLLAANGDMVGRLTAAATAEDASPERRRHLYGLLKNMCFSSELHPALCQPRTGLLVALATPLCGPEVSGQAGRLCLCVASGNVFHILVS